MAPLIAESAAVPRAVVPSAGASGRARAAASAAPPRGSAAKPARVARYAPSVTRSCTKRTGRPRGPRARNTRPEIASCIPATSEPKPPIASPARAPAACTSARCTEGNVSHGSEGDQDVGAG